MWALVLARLAELGLAIVSAVKSFSAAVIQWQAIALGRTEGRADSEAAQAAEARQASDRMQAIAGKPAERDEIIKRLEEGSA